MLVAISLCSTYRQLEHLPILGHVTSVNPGHVTRKGLYSRPLEPLLIDSFKYILLQTDVF
jgi:hypothetical protein